MWKAVLREVDWSSYWHIRLPRAVLSLLSDVPHVKSNLACHCRAEQRGPASSSYAECPRQQFRNKHACIIHTSRHCCQWQTAIATPHLSVQCFALRKQKSASLVTGNCRTCTGSARTLHSCHLSLQASLYKSVHVKFCRAIYGLQLYTHCNLQLSVCLLNHDLLFDLFVCVLSHDLMISHLQQRTTWTVRPSHIRSHVH